MKIIPMNQWTYGQDEEYWDNNWFSTKEEAIEAGKNYYLGEMFYIGQGYNIEFTQEQCEWFDLATNVIDSMYDSLQGEVGEVAEYWINQITQKDEEDLNNRIGKVIMKWIENRIGQPNVFLIDDVEIVTEEKENGSR